MRVLEALQDLTHSAVTFAEHMEDVILQKFLHGVKNGFYIDVGCAWPEKASVTNLFYQSGWRGVNIDARREMMDLYKTRRANDVNICIGVSDKSGVLDFYEDGGCSTVSAEDAQARGLKKTGQVKTTTLTNILDKLDTPEDIHFLKIDVERHEKEVLLGTDFSRYRPWMIAMESTLPTTLIPCFEDWEYILLDNGYRYVKSDLLNRYYCRLDKKDELLANYIAAPLGSVIRLEHRVAAQRLLQALFSD